MKVDAYAGDNSVYPTGTDSITYGTGGVDEQAATLDPALVGRHPGPAAGHRGTGIGNGRYHIVGCAVVTSVASLEGDRCTIS